MLFALDDSIEFPPVHFSEPDGLLAMGGDLRPERLINAYRNGIFPWYENDPILWWCPDPRFVLFPSEVYTSKSMQSEFRKGRFRFSTDQAFPDVIRNCKVTRRAGQDSTWITPEVEHAYTNLHRLGYAHSAEAWLNDKLVGGLYGIRLGKVFFGESMFSHESNASKFAFISYVRQLSKEGVKLIDCQVYTSHLESLGARMIPRSAFIDTLKTLVD
ncbi:MAG TPA: leucyl/phenylalanyl-tRNA--protein transferase [Flavitalea sp.]|nr:leucyl/phenylalanyl-tRNA--protein transferase [Flavitalea sp.]